MHVQQCVRLDLLLNITAYLMARLRCKDCLRLPTVSKKRG